jgi:hypothetical protein
VDLPGWIASLPVDPGDWLQMTKGKVLSVEHQYAN